MRTPKERDPSETSAIASYPGGRDCMSLQGSFRRLPFQIFECFSLRAFTASSSSISLFLSAETAYFRFPSLDHSVYHSHLPRTLPNCLSDFERLVVLVTFPQSPIVRVLIGKTLILPFMESHCRVFVPAVQRNNRQRTFARVELSGSVSRINK